MAQEKTKENSKKHVPKFYGYSTNLTGMVGLNTIPTARMDKVGTVRAGISTTDPHLHSFIGFQIAKPLYLNVRNTSEVSNLLSDPSDFYPGLDVKLRLVEETSTRPAVVIGMDSAIGRKRMASEYIAVSKRFNNFDITGGLAWGRLGSAGHIKNPLAGVSSHFDKERDYNSVVMQDANDWFTGDEAGFFGGIEYHTPIDKLSLKLDYGAIDYIGEQITDSDFDPPSPWAISFNYKPWEQIDLSAGIIGGKKLMARLSIQDQLFNLPVSSSQKMTPPALHNERVKNERVKKPKTKTNFSILNLFSKKPTGQQIGHASIHLANNSPEELESLELQIKSKGLTGPKTTIIRRDLETALLENNGSPEEIWQDTLIEQPERRKFSLEKLLNDNSKHPYHLRLISDNKISISEPYAGVLYRSSLLAEAEKEWPLGITTGVGLRYNVKDNLDRIEPFRLPFLQGGRADEPEFADRRFAVDRLYGAWFKSITPNTHMSLIGGYLEEMYAGYGGEILYRPFGKTFAIGVEGWQAYKRDPKSSLNRDIDDRAVSTGHLNLFYEMPNSNFTAYGKIGQYLREDFGGTLGLKNKFDNGTSIEGFLTISDLAYEDLIGNKTYLHGGIRLNIPLGSIPIIPDGSVVRLNVGPLARETGQTLENPHPLYDVTEPISYRQLSRSWKTLLD